MLKLTKSATEVFGSTEDLNSLRVQFDQKHWIRLLKILDSNLLELVRSQIDQASFYQGIHEGIAVELCMTQSKTLDLLRFITNDPTLFQIIQQITGCKRIGCFTGRVYRMMSGSGHYDRWHNDLVEHRKIGMSINLSVETYSGGLLQIRDRHSQRIVQEVANVGFGDAIVFRLADSLQHRITDVEGSAPKTAFAGWFQSQPDIVTLLKRNPAPSRKEVLSSATADLEISD